MSEQSRLVRMSEQSRLVNIGDNQILIDWGSAGALLMGLGPDESPIVFGLDSLDELLDVLHKARREIAKVKRVARIIRLPATLNDALEEKTRREGISRNAAIIEAIESYLVE